MFQKINRDCFQGDPVVILTKAVLFVTVAYWGILFILTHIPPAQAPEIGSADKLLHLAAYMLLAFLVGSSLLATRHWNRLSISAGMILLVFYAGFDELTQMLVGRTASWKDWNADLIGIMLGTAVCAAAIHLFRQNHLMQPLLQQEKK